MLNFLRPLIIMFGPSSLLLQAAINIPIAILGFWVVPEKIFKPLGDYVWKDTFFKQIEIMNLSSNINLYKVDIPNRKVSKLIT